MSLREFILNEKTKDTKLEDKIEKIISDEIDYKKIKFDYNNNQMMVYITPEDEDENCLALGKKLEKMFKNKIPGFIVSNDTQNKGSFTIDLSVETLKESTLSEEVKMIMSERPSLVIKVGRLKKLKKFHKTSQFKNVIHKKNLRALKTAAGIALKRKKKRYMKKYTKKYGKIMALRNKKYKNIKESFGYLNEGFKFVKKPEFYGVSNLLFSDDFSNFLLDYIIKEKKTFKNETSVSFIDEEGIPKYGVAEITEYVKNTGGLYIWVLNQEGDMVMYKTSDFPYELRNYYHKYLAFKEMMKEYLDIDTGNDTIGFFNKLSKLNSSKFIEFFENNFNPKVEFISKDNGYIKCKRYSDYGGVLEISSNSKTIVYKLTEINFSDEKTKELFKLSDEIYKKFNFKNSDDIFNFWGKKEKDYIKENIYPKEKMYYTEKEYKPFLDEITSTLLELGQKKKLDLYIKDVRKTYDEVSKDKPLTITFTITKTRSK